MADRENSWHPPAFLLRWAAIGGCLIVIGVALFGLALLLGRLSLVLLPIVVATFLTRILIVPAAALERRGAKPALRAAIVVLGFLAAIGGLGALVAPPMADELSNLGPTLSDGVDQIEDWIVRDGPGDLDREELERLEEQAVEQARDAASNSGVQVAEGAQRVLEVLTGIILALILTFFAVKDGPLLQQSVLKRLSPDRQLEVSNMARAGWAALGGYLRGAAMLGIVEGIMIGLAMYLVGAGLVLPIMLLTFAAAFLPLVGAVLAGAAAVLTTLVTAGGPEALIVLVVAIVVQQLDNDLLAPWIYGRALQLHPATILLSITAGTALFGFAGTIMAVPVTAVVTSAFGARTRRSVLDHGGSQDASGGLDLPRDLSPDDG